MSAILDTIVIGAGQAGLATGYHLQRARLSFTILEAATEVGGQPFHHRGVSSTVPGLAYVGLSNQSTYASATLRGVGPDAAYVVRHLRHHLRASDSALAGNTSIRRRLFDGWRCCAGKAGAI